RLFPVVQGLVATPARSAGPRGPRAFDDVSMGGLEHRFFEPGVQGFFDVARTDQPAALGEDLNFQGPGDLLTEPYRDVAALGDDAVVGLLCQFSRRLPVGIAE